MSHADDTRRRGLCDYDVGPDSHRGGLARGVLIANALSFARIPLAGLLWVMPFELGWTLSIVVLAAITDVLDGYWIRRARKLRWRDGDPSAFAAGVAQGAAIDGFADKFFASSAMLLLAFTQSPPIWTLVAMMMREIIFVPMMLVYRAAPAEQRERVDFTAGWIGKSATLAQFLALVAGLTGHIYFPYLAIAAGALGAVAAAHYLARAAATASRS
jgi:phosphatidylglycerophosphate synthase